MACFSACIFVNTALSEQLNLPNTNTDYRKEGRERVRTGEEARRAMKKSEKEGRRVRKGNRVTMGGEVCGAMDGHTAKQSRASRIIISSVSAATGCSHVKVRKSKLCDVHTHIDTPLADPSPHVIISTLWPEVQQAGTEAEELASLIIWPACDRWRRQALVLP